MWAGLCAGRRGFARHRHPHGDALLVWWQTGGALHRREALEYLGLRAGVKWTCRPDVARMAVEHAMQAVASRHAPPAQVAAKELGIRKEAFLRLRGEAVAWLRNGIDRAAAAYRTGTASTCV